MIHHTISIAKRPISYPRFSFLCEFISLSLQFPLAFKWIQSLFYVIVKRKILNFSDINNTRKTFSDKNIDTCEFKWPLGQLLVLSTPHYSESQGRSRACSGLLWSRNRRKIRAGAIISERLDPEIKPKCKGRNWSWSRPKYPNQVRTRKYTFQWEKKN